MLRERALQRYALDVLLEYGFTPFATPDVVALELEGGDALLVAPTKKEARNRIRSGTRVFACIRTRVSPSGPGAC